MGASRSEGAPEGAPNVIQVCGEKLSDCATPPNFNAVDFQPGRDILGIRGFARFESNAKTYQQFSFKIVLDLTMVFIMVAGNHAMGTPSLRR